ncbi:hypothetical protein [Streptomonospora alba]|uniref:hypothetical protein n=1 Tax=Streptomonospora alba TaxID=183763 RepID=UPI0012ED17FE|nr:hypothetical protein [Streptomonospora alba]
MPDAPVPSAVRVAQAVCLGFVAVAAVRGLVSIAVALSAGEEEPGYVLGYFGVGPALALVFAGSTAWLIRRPGRFAFAFALVTASGMCLAGLLNLRDAPPVGLLYGALGATALVFVFLSTSFLLGRDEGRAPQAGPYVGPQPYPGQPIPQRPHPQQQWQQQSWQESAPAPQRPQPPHGGPAGR